MSQWGRESSAQPQAPGPVTLFDPSKFQKSLNFPTVPASQPGSTKSQGQSQTQTAVSDSVTGSHTTWGAWGANPWINDFSVSNQEAGDDTSQHNSYMQNNQQNWYGQNQWDANQQNVNQGNFDQTGQGHFDQTGQGHFDQTGQGQWNQTAQGQWDPNNQWNQNQYGYQQGADTNQTGFNGYWTGQEGNYQQENYANWNGQNASGDNYFTGDPSIQYDHSGASYFQNGPDQEVSADSENVTSQGEGNTNELDVSQSSESGEQSLNQSLGNVEDGDHADDEENDDEESEEEEEEDDEEDEDSNNNSSRQGGGNSHIQHENELGSQAVNTGHNVEPLTAYSESVAEEVTSQMHALNIQNNFVMHNDNQQQEIVPGVHFYPDQRSEHMFEGVEPQLPSEEQQHAFLPPQQESAQVESNEDVEDNSETGKQATPTFSDWEMIPHQAASGTHSRNPSTDNNVKFFISSTSSSARVSPATSSKAGDEPAGNIQEPENKKTENEPNGPGTDEVHAKEAHVESPAPHFLGPPPMRGQAPPVGPPAVPGVAPPVGPPAGQGLAPPPAVSGGNRGVNPFRKSPNMEPVRSSSGGDLSMLSSTRLDATRPNFENSPVVLDKSMSPIQGDREQRQNEEKEDSPEVEDSARHHSDVTPDTPLSSHSKRGAGVPQSPIIPRKESPFQPPGKESKIKSVKASHDTVVEPRKAVSENTKTGSEDNGSDRRREQESRGGRTPDWDSQDKYKENRNLTKEAKVQSQKNRGQRNRDRDGYYNDKERYSSNSDRLVTRPPSGSSGTERGSTNRTRQSAFHPTHRNRNNVSPAASLLDVAESVSSVSNILLMPASNTSSGPQVSVSGGPTELTPVVSLISSMSEQIGTDKSNSGKKGAKNSDRNGDRDIRERSSDLDLDRERDRYRDKDYHSRTSRERDLDRSDIRPNRSYESLRDRRDHSRNNSRDRNASVYDSRESLERDDSRDRTKRGDSRERERSYRDDYYDRYRDRYRPPSRTSTVDTRRDYRDRDRDRDSYRRTDRYDRDRDRPRSRQGDRERDLPSSRHGDTDRPRSRTDYDREIEKYREKYRDYNYDEYYRRQYYDPRYYDYYYGSTGQGGYYDEYGYYRGEPTAPRYQYEHYRRRSRAGTPGSLSDGGEEIASIADKSKKSEVKSDPKRFDYPPGLHDYGSQRGYDEYYSYYGYEQNGHRWDPNVMAWVANTEEVVPQRQTPEKFMIPHVRACFGPNGQLVKVLPNRPADGQPATIEIHDVQAMLEENEEAQCLREFPGPLVRGDTHKNDVLLFCQTKAKTCSENMDLPDRESAELIWRFLELLIKQNGTIVGTDIADLILQGHEPTTQEYRRIGMKITPSSDNLETGDDESEDSQKISRGSTPIDRTVMNRGKSVEEVTDRFRHLLMYGRKKDALEWSMKNNLWGHALFLASKMDTRAHANVMARFANMAMRMNDPLQTLYQLMSGRQPAAVTCIGEERWGEWRPHLAMILSNHSQKPDLDRKSITTLGDTLASRGFLHASHFCYLMSQTGFGSYNKKSSKIVLIGSSHGLPLEYFASNEAIQCTEIYEYALSLANAAICLANFQTFKFLYATRLSDYGFAQEALQYCEVISKHINMNPAYYTHILVKLVYDLSSQLKFSHPDLEDDDEKPDPDWLRALHTTLVQFEEGAIQAVSGTVTPAYFGGRTTASSDSGEVGMYMQGADNGSMYPQDASYLQPGGMYSIHEQSSQYQQGHGGVQEQQQQYLGSGYPQGYDASQQYSADHMTGSELQNEAGADNQHQYQQEGNFNQHQGHDEAVSSLHWPDHQYQHQGFESTNQNHTESDSTNQNEGHQEPSSHWSHQQQHYQPQKTGFHPDVNLGESQTSVTSASSAKRSSVTSTSGISQEDVDQDEETDQADSTGFHHPPSIFDIQPAQHKIIPPKLRKRTISEASTESGRDRHPSGSRGQTAQQTNQKSQEMDLMPQGKSKQGAAGGGIWGKIGGLFSRKNEMKLPDDKEPSIVWDPDKKRWVDKTAEEQDEKPPPPPPKDHELPGSSLGPSAGSQAPPGPASVPAPIPSQGESSEQAQGGSNKFSRRRVSKGPRYVDVMNPKPTTSSSVPSNLFHTLPSSHSAPAIFNPMGNQDNGSSDSGSQVNDSIPEEKDPGEENSKPIEQNLQLPPTNNNLSRNSSASSLSTEVQRIMSKVSTSSDTALTSAPKMPAFFDPTQFSGSQTAKPAVPSGPGHRLTNRRVYPKR